MFNAMGGVLKGMARKVIAQTQAMGEVEIQSVLEESCLTKNSLLRNGGYSASKWVLGKAPGEAPTLVSEDHFADLGVIEDPFDPESRFALQHQARLEAKQAFIHLDTSKREQRALLRSAKPTPQAYSVGDVVCFRRDNQPGRTTWSPASRVIGCEGNENQNVWVLCEIPSMWVDTIQNIHDKHKPDYVPEFKSRLVSCGNFEDAECVRSDAPTSDVETHALVAVFAGCHGVPLFSSDIQNAYFEAMAVTMRQPQSGLPGVDPDAFLLIRVPVYGLCDSGRGFWKKSTATLQRSDC